MKYVVVLEYRSYETVKVDAENEKQAKEKAIEMQPFIRRDYGRDVYKADIKTEEPQCKST